MVIEGPVIHSGLTIPRQFALPPCPARTASAGIKFAPSPDNPPAGRASNPHSDARGRFGLSGHLLRRRRPLAGGRSTR